MVALGLDALDGAAWDELPVVLERMDSGTTLSAVFNCSSLAPSATITTPVTGRDVAGLPFLPAVLGLLVRTTWVHMDIGVVTEDNTQHACKQHAAQTH